MDRRLRFNGRIASWNDERGFGFIAPDQGGEEIFLHVKSVSGRAGRPHAGQMVSFAVATAPGGRKRATDVRLHVDRAPRPAGPARRDPPARWGFASRLALPLFAAIWFACARQGEVPAWWGGVYAGMSLLSFAAYAVDKAAARAGRWRTSEGTLLVLGLACGWPGALLAQQWLRHKSSKQPFRAMFWGTVTLNVAGFVALAGGWVR